MAGADRPAGPVSACAAVAGAVTPAPPSAAAATATAIHRGISGPPVFDKYVIRINNGLSFFLSTVVRRRDGDLS
ncbi:hypothetical protein Sru01_67050 [Sphaerisporangium rufum]|uniref:Uncharacterized protein n=1 Tax=Sphaerisporangium rufum TaxID=1381558 RepID=A0A919R9I4_9ACTN|nr:hypothetical protein Sru01_67050 [Sphaerisporangium rufum]